MSNFESILDRPIGSTPKPKPIPIGTYLCVVKGFKVQNNVGPNKVDKITIECPIISPDADVDQGQLRDLPGGLSGKALLPQFWLTEEDIYKLESFLKDGLGLEGMSTKQGISQMSGRQVKIHTRHRAGDGDKIYNDCDMFARV